MMSMLIVMMIVLMMMLMIVLMLMLMVIMCFAMLVMHALIANYHIITVSLCAQLLFNDVLRAQSSLNVVQSHLSISQPPHLTIYLIEHTHQ
jgi:hypothetical protein